MRRTNFLWDFEIQTDHLIPARRPDLEIVNKKKEKKKKENLPNSGLCNRCVRNNSQRFGKGACRFRNQRTSRDYQDYNIINIGQNTEKSPEELMSLKLQ